MCSQKKKTSPKVPFVNCSLSRRDLMKGALGAGIALVGLGCSSSDSDNNDWENGTGHTDTTDYSQDTRGTDTGPGGDTATGVDTARATDTGSATGDETIEDTGTDTGTDTGIDNDKAKVYIYSTTDRATGLAALLEMVDMSFANGRDVVLKPNFNSANPFPATTHNDTIIGVATALKDVGAQEIILAESSGTTETITAFNTKGIPQLCNTHGITLINYDDYDSSEYESFSFPGMNWPGGRLALPRLVRSDRAVVLLPCLKTHIWGEMTLSLKLAVGLVQTQRRWDELHPRGGGNIALIAEINMGYKADLIVLDALLGFKDGGPDEGTECSPGLLIAATDRVALDAVGLAVLKLYDARSRSGPFGAIFEQGQIRRAVELGIDNARSPDDIELIGNDSNVINQIRGILDMG